MAVNLCPWPSTPAALAAARQCVREGTGYEGTADEPELVLSDSRLDMMAETACEIVQRYAPMAPDAMKREAVFRLVGYLYGSDYGGIASEATGPRTVTYTPNHADFARRSGALALLSPYRIRRAGVF